MNFFEDIDVGDSVALGRHTFTAEESRPSRTDTIRRRFHVDEAAAAASHFGALCASGWHTAVVWMRLMVDYQRARGRGRARARRARGAGLGPSPGFRELKWLKPVYVGDTIDYRNRGRRKRAPPTAGPVAD